MEKYDYLIVGAGLFGAVFAYEVTQRGKKCLIIDKRDHIGGNLYCEMIEGIPVHKYGAHIFHTNKKEIWDYVNRLTRFKPFVNSPVAHYKGKLYNLPFNMNTFYTLWGVTTPKEAEAKIKEQVALSKVEHPTNLEEQALSLVGKDIYEILIKGYTEKQWGKKATQLPAFIIKRLPVRFTFDNNYFNDTYQGIPESSYNDMIHYLLKDSDVKTNTDFFEHRQEYENIAAKIVYTGMIDEYYNYTYGELGYRSLKFSEEIINEENYQGNAVINYTEYEIPYTRIIEHKHFLGIKSDRTVITKEYPQAWDKEKEPYYPINDTVNNERYSKYKELTNKEEKIIFGGRLGEYKYYDMDKIIERALELAKQELEHSL